MSSEDTSQIIEKEPLLKYMRLRGDLEMACTSNLFSCAAFHKKHYAVGTTEGTVILLDNNNKIIRTLNNHKHKITAIDFDRTGDYIISGSEDGIVCLSTVLDTDKVLRDFKSPITGLYIDENISINRDHSYIVSTLSGLLLSTRKSLMGIKDTILGDSNRQSIYRIAKNQNLLAYAYEGGVVLYELNKKKKITEVNRYNECPDIQYIYPQLYWKDPKTLLIGWGEVIKVLKLEYKVLGTKSNEWTYEAIVSSITKHDFWVNGLGYVDEDHYLFFSYPAFTPEEGKAPDDEPPQILTLDFDSHHIQEGNTLDGEEFYGHSATDYYITHLSYKDIQDSRITSSSIEYNYTYIVAPKCILRIHKRTFFDHLKWFEDRHQFEEALKLCLDPSNHASESLIQSIRSDHLQYLFNTQQYEQTAKLLGNYLQGNAESWIQWIFKFIPLNQVEVLVPYIPLESPRLNTETYTLILCYFIHQNTSQFLYLIKTWPLLLRDSTPLYDIDKLLSVLDEIQPLNDPNLIEGKVELYIKKDMPEQAITLYLDSGLQSQGSDFLGLIQKYNLYSIIKNKIKPLMLFDAQKTSDLLTRHTSEIPPECVYEQLSASPELLVVYLNSLLLNNTSLYNKEQYKDIQHLHLSLIVDYCPETLLNYLREAAYCDFEEAQNLCIHHNPPLHKDLVFLLTRLGNTTEALKKSVYDIGDAKYCIEYVKNNNQYNLWEDLVNMSFDKPTFVSELLDNITDHIDPLILLNKIPGDMEIDDLKNKLKRILENYSLEISLQESCRDIILYDLTSLVKQYVALKQHGVSVNPQDLCPICERPLIQTYVENRKIVYKDIVVYPCKHVYHYECLTKFPSLLCYDEDHDDYIYKCYLCNYLPEDHE